MSDPIDLTKDPSTPEDLGPDQKAAEEEGKTTKNGSKLLIEENDRFLRILVRTKTGEVARLVVNGEGTIHIAKAGAKDDTPAPDDTKTDDKDKKTEE